MPTKRANSINHKASVNDEIVSELTSSQIEKFLLLSQAPIAFEEKKGRVMTIFFCGTGSNKEDYMNTEAYFKGENVSHAFHITEGEEYIDKLIIDGPGSGEHDIDDLFVEYNNGTNKPYTFELGTGLAYGMDERREHVLAVLKNKPTKSKLSEKAQAAHEKLEKQPHFTRINMIGWSRGAAKGAIEFAHMMAKDDELKDIEVNLFLLDPVPGLGLSNAYNRVLSKNVKVCIAIYAKDERSAGFAAVVPDVPEGCQFIPIFLPGGHAQVAGSDKDHGGKAMENIDLQSVGILSRFYLERFLQFFGTKLDQNQALHYKLSDVVDLYEKIKKNANHYKELAIRVPYTKNQILGKSRKVAHGNKSYTNKSLRLVEKELCPPYDTTQYLNYDHQFLVTQISEANTQVNHFEKIIEELFQKNEWLDIDSIFSAIENQWNELKNWKELKNSVQPHFLYCAISEELQEKYHPEYLLDTNKRCYTYESLMGYVKKIVETEEMKKKISDHNKEIIQPKQEMLSAALTTDRNNHDSFIESLFEKFCESLENTINKNDKDDLVLSNDSLFGKCAKFLEEKLLLLNPYVLITLNNKLESQYKDLTDDSKEINPEEKLKSTIKKITSAKTITHNSKIKKRIEEQQEKAAKDLATNFLNIFNTIEEALKFDSSNQIIIRIKETLKPFKEFNQKQKGRFINQLPDDFRHLKLSEDNCNEKLYICCCEKINSIENEKKAKIWAKSFIDANYTTIKFPCIENLTVEEQKSQKKLFKENYKEHFLTLSLKNNEYLSVCTTANNNILIDLYAELMVDKNYRDDFKTHALKNIRKTTEKQEPEDKIKESLKYINAKIKLIELLENQQTRIENRTSIFFSKDKGKRKKDALKRAKNEISELQQFKDIKSKSLALLQNKDITQCRNVLNPFSLFGGSTTKKQLENYVNNTLRRQ